METGTTAKRKAAPAAAANGQPEHRAPSRDEYTKTRTVWGEAPSGHWFRLRPVDMELHALAGGLPTKLRRLAGLSATQLGRLLAEDNSGGQEAMAAVKDYMVQAIRLMVVEPDLAEWDLEDDLLPADRIWLLQVAQLETDTDAQGRRLWGREPLGRWATFREEHGCGEDCEACTRLSERFSQVLGG